MPPKNPVSLKNAVLNESAPQAARGVIVDTDPCAAELSVQPWQLLILPKSTQVAYNTHREYLTTPNLLIYTEKFSAAATMVGATPRDMLSIVVPLQTTVQSNYFSKMVDKTELLAGFDSDVDVEFDDGHLHLVILIDRHYLASVMMPEEFNQLAMAIQGRWLTVNSSTRVTVVRFLRSLLQLTQEAPETLAHRQGIAQMEDDIVSSVLDLVWSSRACPQQYSAPLRRKGFERALQFLSEHSDELFSPSVVDMCHAAGVSQRTLEYAFRDHIGLTPKRYLKMTKLHSLRRRLMVEEEGSSVQDIAMQLGLYELGRIAGEYRTAFGEYPSDTLHNSHASSRFSLRNASAIFA